MEPLANLHDGRVGAVEVGHRVHDYGLRRHVLAELKERFLAFGLCPERQRRKGEKEKRHKGEKVKREGSPNKSLHICLLFLLKDKKVSHYY